jgi:hypothetical protein
MLLVDLTPLDQRLGQRDHHLRVIGVGASSLPRLHHLPSHRDRGVRQPLERHPQRVVNEGAQQRATCPVPDRRKKREVVTRPLSHRRDQRALPDPGLAADEHNATATGSRILDCVSERPKLIPHAREAAPPVRP